MARSQTMRAQKVKAIKDVNGQGARAWKVPNISSNILVFHLIQHFLQLFDSS